MKLTRKQFNILIDNGYTVADITNIENSKFKFEYTDDRETPDDKWNRCTRDTAFDTLGEENFLIGVARASINGSSIRNNSNNYVYIEKRIK